MEEAAAGGIMNIENIPPELMLEIFSRLPIRSLFQIKSVCEHWDALAKDPRLPTMHLARASTNEGEETLILTYEFDVNGETDIKLMTKHCTSLKVLFHFPSWCRVRHSLDGLLCIEEYGRKLRVFVSNPLTGKHLNLPLPTAISRPSTLPHFGLGFDSSLAKYKIVCVYLWEIDRDNRRYNLGAQVYTINGASGSVSWRETISQPPVPIKLGEHSVYARGVRHWLVGHTYSPNHLETMVISFDFEKEEFKTLPRREFFSSSVELVDLRGYLGMVDLSRAWDLSGGRSCAEIWKLKDYEKNEWVKEYRFDMLPPTYDPLHVHHHIHVVGLMGQDEIVLLRYSESVNLLSHMLRRWMLPWWPTI